MTKLLCGLCRYELPGINAFNFVLEDALGGGGVTSLRSDPQVKWNVFFFIMEFSEKDFLSDWTLARPNCFASRVEPKKRR